MTCPICQRPTDGQENHGRCVERILDAMRAEVERLRGIIYDAGIMRRGQL